MPFPQYAKYYFNRVKPSEWKLSHFLHYTEKSQSNSWSKDQILHAFKTGLNDVVEKISDKGNRPTIFRSRVALEVADMTKPRNLAGAKLLIVKKLLENKRTKYESDEVESYWQTVRAKTAINIAKSHHKLQKVSQKTVNLLCEGESRKRMRPDDEVFSSSKDCEDDDKINSHTVYKVKETENSSGNESDDNQNDEIPKDCLRNWMDNEDDELEVHAKETIQNDEGKWIISGTDVRGVLLKWKEKTRSRNDLAFYDISKLLPTPVINNADRIKQYIIGFIKTKNFCEYVDESYAKIRNNNIMKFVWDYLNLL
ncbi:unnamed protein product [Rhizophagus irregularis]|uniref:Uncharacterized protein n=1 Tax=Rhizophagus irregularis TaxID=588596 RepID=A0A915ZI33_9GLOM|nr:unnamed protein product [Rhizophagus irregularis]